MDSDDQVAAAALHNHHHHLTDDTMPTAGGGESWCRALVRRGWDLSRKAAIAGAAATAAPVVAPPLVLLSAAGLALSFPFAAYLASLAATERLMGALLPSYPPLPPEADHVYAQDDDDVEQEFHDASEEYGQEAPGLDDASGTEEDDDINASSLPPPLAGEKDFVAEGKHAFEQPGQEQFDSNLRDKSCGAISMEENKSAAMEMLPWSFDVCESSVAVLRDESNMVLKMGEGEVAGKESGHEPIAPENGDKIRHGSGTTMEAVSLASDVFELPVPLLGVNDIVVQIQGEDGATAQKLDQDSPVLKTWDKTEDDKVTVDTDIAMQHSDACETVPVFTDKDNVLPIIPNEVSEVAVEVVVEEVASDTNVVTREVVDVQVDVFAIAASESKGMPPSVLAASESLEVVDTACIADVVGVTVMEDIVREFTDAKTEGVEQQNQGHDSSVSMVTALSACDGEDATSSGSTTYIPTIVDETMDLESRSDSDHQATCVEYLVMNKRFGKKAAAGSKHFYTEAQLREQLDTIRTITGYRSLPSSTLESELAGLHIFVGVEPPVSSTDASDLTELNAKLRLLKSIIGVD